MSNPQPSRALNALYALNAAIRNLRLYPPASTLIKNAVAKAHAAVQQGCDAGGGELLLAESEKRLLIGDTPLNESDQRKPQVAAFLQLMLDFGIESLSFSAGLDRDELARFLDLLTKDPESLADQGGLEEILAARNMSHIVLNAKHFVAASDAAAGAGGTGLAGSGSGTGPGQGRSSGGGLGQGRSSGGGLGLGSGRSFGGGPGPGLADSRKKFSGARGTQAAGEAAGPATTGPPGGGPSGSAAGGASRGGETFQDIVASASGSNRTALRACFRAAIKGDRRAFQNKEFVAWLPEAVMQLQQSGKKRIASELVARLGDELLAGDPAQRPAIAEALSAIGDSWAQTAPAKEQQRLMTKLLAWVKLETELSPALVRVVERLTGMAQTYLANNKIQQCRMIVETLHGIGRGDLRRPEPIQELMEEALVSLIGPKSVYQLLEFLQDQDENRQAQASATLEMMVPEAVKYLLLRVKESDNMSERLRIIRAISQIGAPALPPIVEQIQQRPGPWYYLRNLVVILGKIGDESQIAVLAPLLRASDKRIQKEALSSIARIGGVAVDRVLLPFFGEADDDLRLRIVELWGSMKSKGAVEPLVALLRNKPMVTTRARADLEEKICFALGKIGTPSALKALKTVTRRKGLLGVKSYGVRVVDAAKKALADAGA